MTLTEIIAEMVARGADSNTTRNGRWANVAYRKIINKHDWSFSTTATTGSANAGTVTVATFRKAIVVGDLGSTALPPGRRLDKITYEEIAEVIQGENISVAGTPEFWWYDGVAGSIKAFPLGGTIYARYHQRIAPLTANDEPIFDEEYHPLVVDRAMVEVYKDVNEMVTAREALSQYYADLAEMAQDYQVFSREHSFIQVPDAYDG